MQLLRQALDKLQSETQVVDDELARAREQAIFNELERAELSNNLELKRAQLQACKANIAELKCDVVRAKEDALGVTRGKGRTSIINVLCGAECMNQQVFRGGGRCLDGRA